MNNTSKPVYLKLRDIIAESILDGDYREGDMLPSVRVFAADQGANPLTVAKAYQGFQDEGLVVILAGSEAAAVALAGPAGGADRRQSDGVADAGKPAGG